MAPAHAGLFDDDEARKQIAAERRRVDDLTNELKQQQAALDARTSKVEEALKNQSLLDLFSQIEALRADMNKLRGQIEVLNNNVENTAKRQADMYLDLDTRMRRFEQPGGPGPAADAPAAGSPPQTPPAVAGAAPAAPDGSAEARAYDAAQGLRRAGNYQGAIGAFQNFIKQYPKSNLAPRAQYWIGDSFFNLRDYKQAIANQQVLLKAYPDSASVPDSLLNIASSQIEMGDVATGKKTLEELVSKYPLAEAAEKAKRRITALNTAGGATARP